MEDEEDKLNPATVDGVAPPVNNDDAQLLTSASEQKETNERKKEEDGEDPCKDFAIPELPSGEKLCFVLISAWDDPFFMGLNAIEVFTDKGARAEVKSIETTAVESFGELESLLCCKTCPCTDPQGMWLCRHAPDEPPISVTINLCAAQTIAMIRIWNYCESRVHALRGVRRMRIELDERCIFRGEISCAFSGDNEAGKPLGDTILFTTNEVILNLIAENDVFLTEAEDQAIPSSQLDMLSLESSTDNENFTTSSSSFTNMDIDIQRPLTGNALSSSCSSPAPYAKLSGGNLTAAMSTSFPVLTEPSGMIQNSSQTSVSKLEAAKLETAHDEHSNEEDEDIIKGKVFHMELTANWGCSDLIGMTGIQFLGPRSEPISTEHCVIRCSTEVISQANSNSLMNLVNGKNLTCNSDDMWLTTATQDGSPPTLSFTFAHEVELCGVSIWNYNASPELTYAGVKCAQFFANGRPIVNSVLLRRAPGYVFFDYVQDVMFDRCHLFRPLTSRPNTNSISAFIFQLRLLSSWGDEYYIGLNGIELYNRRNQLIRLKLQNLAAFPESPSITTTEAKNVTKNQRLKAEKSARDPRSSDKLIDGINDTKKPQHMWLTPILPNRYVRIFLIFDAPTFVSKIRIYNYRKTPERGVRHIAVSADDLIIYSGEVPLSSSETTGVLDISLRDLD